MPDNAARALATFIEGWIVLPQGTSTETLRWGKVAKNDISVWHQEADLISLLRDVERDLQVLAMNGKRVSQISRHVPAIYELLLGYTIGWTDKAQQSRRALPDAALDALWSLAELIDAVGLQPDLSEGDFAALSAQLDSLLESLEADSIMDASSQKYLVALTNELRQAAADTERFGTALVRRLSNELAGVLLGEAAVADPASENRRRYFEAALTLAKFGATTVAATALQIGTATVLKQLGM
jgi:hypothetical protein